MDLPSFESGTVHSKLKGFKYQNTKKIKLPKYMAWSDFMA
jgi:hypothetical protein